MARLAYFIALLKNGGDNFISSVALMFRQRNKECLTFLEPR